ncbi:MAG: flavodoxin family protein [Candidatus Altiarchaeia archaeon]
MKAVGFIGSPRKGGSTEILVNEILAGASEKGAQIAVYNVTELNIKGCKACYSCRDRIGCILKDDMQKLYEEINKASAVVFGSPIYMWQMSGQMKLFIDRLLPFQNPGSPLKKGKRKDLILAFTQGQTDSALFMPYYESTGEMLEVLGFNIKGLIVAPGVDEKGGVLKQKDTLKKARMMGRDLFN